MLTATYTLVALSVEQANVRVSLLSFQQYVRSTLMRQSHVTLSQLEYACESLHRLYQACHWRKIEMYLIPAIRQATEQADQLLDELGRLNQAALAVIRSLQEQLNQTGQASAQRERLAADVCVAIERCCDAMLRRLDKEEQELFAVARSVIGGEVWFSIANQFLLHDARVAEARRSMPEAAPESGAAGADAAPAPQADWPGVNVVALPVVLTGKALQAEQHAYEQPEWQGQRRLWPPSKVAHD